MQSTRELKDVGFGFHFGGVSRHVASTAPQADVTARHKGEEACESRASAPLVKSRAERSVPHTKDSPSPTLSEPAEGSKPVAKTRKRARAAPTKAGLRAPASRAPRKKRKIEDESSEDEFVDAVESLTPPARANTRRKRTRVDSDAQHPVTTFAVNCPTESLPVDGPLKSQCSQRGETDTASLSVPARAPAAVSVELAQSNQKRRGRPRKQQEQQPSKCPDEQSQKPKRGRRPKAQPVVEDFVPEVRNDSGEQQCAAQDEDAKPKRERKLKAAGPRSNAALEAGAMSNATTEPAAPSVKHPSRDHAKQDNGEVDNADLENLQCTDSVSGADLTSTKADKSTRPRSPEPSKKRKRVDRVEEPSTSDPPRPLEQLKKAIHNPPDPLKPSLTNPPSRPQPKSHAPPPVPPNAANHGPNPKANQPRPRRARTAQPAMDKDDGGEGSLGAILARYGNPRIPRSLLDAGDDARLSKFRF